MVITPIFGALGGFCAVANCRSGANTRHLGSRSRSPQPNASGRSAEAQAQGSCPPFQLPPSPSQSALPPLYFISRPFAPSLQILAKTTYRSIINQIIQTLVPAPRSFFMDVKCPGCFTITTVFSHAQTVVICGGCSTVLCQPTGGKARLTEGCSFRRK